MLREQRISRRRRTLRDQRSRRILREQRTREEKIITGRRERGGLRERKLERVCLSRRYMQTTELRGGGVRGFASLREPLSSP